MAADDATLPAGKSRVVRNRRVGNEPRVAVLPFENLSEDSSQDYLCDGIAVEILLSLARTPGLNVVARSAVFALKGESLAMREVGTRLDASVILSGRLRKLNDRILIDVSLTDVRSGETLWSADLDRDLLDVFVVQDQIVAAITDTLGIAGARPPRSIQSIQTTDANAFDYYLKGRELYYQFSRPSVEEATKMFRRAVAIDDAYALAYCGLADCHSYLFMYVESSRAYLELSIEAANLALEIDPSLAEAWASRGLALSLDAQFDESEKAFQRAIELDPQLFEARFLYGRVSWAQGKMDRAARLFEESNRIRPEDFQSLLLAAQAIETLGAKTRAAELRIRGVAAAEQHLKLDPRATRALYLGANGLIGLGQKERALTWLEKALEIDPGEPMMLYNAGCIFALVGETDRALECLEGAVESGLRQKGWFEHDSNLDGVRDQPRFVALVERLV